MWGELYGPDHSPDKRFLSDNKLLIQATQHGSGRPEHCLFLNPYLCLDGVPEGKQGVRSILHG